MSSKKLVLVATVIAGAPIDCAQTKPIPQQERRTIHVKPVQFRKKVVLESPIIEILDGKRWAIDGETYGHILQVRHKVRKMLYGIQSDDLSVTGIYDFEGEKHSIATLAKLESEMGMRYCAAQIDYTNNKISEDTWDAINKQYHATRHDLQELLLNIKKQFELETADYAEGARGTKDQMLMLIQESCEKHNHPDCFLLKWGAVDEEHEHDILYNDIPDMQEMYAFCLDLTNFLEDLARSCPKARAQFMEILKKQQEA